MSEELKVDIETARKLEEVQLSEPLFPVPVYEGGFVQLRKVTTSAATPADETFENIKYAYTLGHKFLHETKYFKDIKGKEARIALVGGGPSLKDNLEELKKFDVIFACGSVHDYLISNNVIPTFAAACDPDPITANYYRNPNNDTTYLIATGCNKKVFDVLKDNKIVIWNCYSDENAGRFKELDPEFHAIGGGCTVGLRAISISIMMGYTNFHFFGFDTCLNDVEEHHAYEFTDPIEYLGLGTIYKMKLGIGRPDEKIYKVAGYQLGQARHYQAFYEQYGNMFSSTFHGTGLLSDLDKLLKEDCKFTTEG